MTQGLGFHALSRVLQAEEWKREGLCKGRADLFFPEKNSDNRTPDKAREGPCPVCNRHDLCFFVPKERLAKSLCARCPVRQQCMDAGMSEEFGIWGGSTAQERVRARRRNQTAEEVLDDMTEQAVAHGLAVREA